LLSPSPLLFPQASALWEKQENTIPWRGLCCAGWEPESAVPRGAAGSRDGAAPCPAAPAGASLGTELLPGRRCPGPEGLCWGLPASGFRGTRRVKSQGTSYASNVLLLWVTQLQWGTWGQKLCPSEGPGSGVRLPDMGTDAVSQ